jgi:LCP family protein required for cell wall assembly
VSNMTSPDPGAPGPVKSGPTAALLSAFVPGLGHAYAGDGRMAWFLFLVDVAAFATLGVLYAAGSIDLIRVSVSPDALVGLMVANVLFLAYRAFAVAAAYRAAPRPDGPAPALALVGAGLLLLGPHLLIGYLAWTQYDLLTTVFAPSTPVAADTTTTSTTEATGTTGPGTTTTTAPTTTTTTQPPRIWDGLGRLNIALLGSDMRPNQEDLDPTDRRYVGHRTDVMIVVSINPEPPYDVAVLSVPRFLSNFEMPEGMGVPRTLDDWDWIGHVYRRAEDIRPERYPGPGTPGENAVKAALGELFGIPIHYYALITVGGFIDLIDALGGVTIEVPRRIVDRNYDTADNHYGATRTTVVIDAGPQKLDGFRALAYARIRSQSHEFARMQRQRCILSAMVDQTNPLQLLLNLGSISEAIKSNLTTDIPVDKLVDFVELLPNLKTENFTTLNIERSAYEIPAPNPSIRYFDIAQIKADAQFLMRDPVGARAALGLSGLDDTCEESLDP